MAVVPRSGQSRAILLELHGLGGRSGRGGGCSASSWSSASHAVCTRGPHATAHYTTLRWLQFAKCLSSVVLERVGAVRTPRLAFQVLLARLRCDCLSLCSWQSCPRGALASLHPNRQPAQSWILGLGPPACQEAVQRMRSQALVAAPCVASCWLSYFVLLSSLNRGCTQERSRISRGGLRLRGCLLELLPAHTPNKRGKGECNAGGGGNGRRGKEEEERRGGSGVGRGEGQCLLRESLGRPSIRTGFPERVPGRS